MTLCASPNVELWQIGNKCAMNERVSSSGRSSFIIPFEIGPLDLGHSEKKLAGALGSPRQECEKPLPLILPLQLSHCQG